MDDIRNHDPLPDAEESAWMKVEAAAALLRACVMAGVALVIGLGASALIEDADATSNVVVFGPR